MVKKPYVKPDARRVEAQELIDRLLKLSGDDLEAADLLRRLMARIGKQPTAD